jgi:hypothetical protein
MNLPKVILPPALSLLFLIAVIYGMGSCMASIPQAYRVKGPWVVETQPERTIVVTESGTDVPITVSLFSWGALFSQGDREMGTLRYERVYYVLRDSHNVAIWRMTSHDTYVAVDDPGGKTLFKIVTLKDRVEIVDAKGRLTSIIVTADDRAALLDIDGATLAEAVPTPSGMDLRAPEGTLMRLPGRSVSPAGLVAAALPQFDRLERAALMIMVK